MTNSWHSYPKVWNFGHAGVKEILLDPVHIEEKVDGSQFSFGIFNGEIKCKSKSQMLDIDHPEKMFSKAIETVKKLAPILKDGYTYRAEYLQKPKHNVLAYLRTPAHYLIIFDINPGEEHYLNYADKKAEADRIGLECVPLLFDNLVTDFSELHRLLEKESVLGGQKIEGFVVKNYTRFGRDKKAMLAKHVSEAFKEKHAVDWKETNPKQNDIIQLMAAAYTSHARWEKSAQHLKESGSLTDSPKDIGLLIKEVKKDVFEECKDEIMEKIFAWAWPQIERQLTSGLPNWYKNKLLLTQELGQEDDQ